VNGCEGFGGRIQTRFGQLFHKNENIVCKKEEEKQEELASGRKVIDKGAE
jgi:hypothetical protein